MAKLQSSNITVIGVMLILTTTIAFMSQKPIHEFDLLDTEKFYFSPFLFIIITLFMCAATVPKGSDIEEQKVRPLPTKEKRGYIMGLLMIIFVSIGAQIILWNIGWERLRSFNVFVISNMFMTSCFMFFVSHRMEDAYTTSYIQFYIPLFVYPATFFFFKFTAPSDSWLYHFYYNTFIITCILEIYAALAGELYQAIPKEVQEKPHVKRVHPNKSEESSDSDWERVSDEEEDDYDSAEDDEIEEEVKDEILIEI
ncbi:hypothetical protein B9Z55_024791 [Caenorhabditis nigoni]|uniref:Uncharacterized protein n=1 Tax=Caenorhabditis nigoni TaxID=1611254 RepID=A0A2G5SVZ3_9PELO|nr:hypothetical protein B9Z55_024791 [Caenorhabditis nigoni]